MIISEGLGRFIFAILIAAAAAIGHERDIANSCEKYGKSHKAGWTIDIVCSVPTKGEE